MIHHEFSLCISMRFRITLSYDIAIDFEQEFLSDAYRPATQHRNSEAESGKTEEPFVISICAVRKSLILWVSIYLRVIIATR
jgi:hypothetical protein